MFKHLSRHLRTATKIRQVKTGMKWMLPPHNQPQPNTTSEDKARLPPGSTLPPAPTTEVPFDFDKLKQSKKFTL